MLKPWSHLFVYQTASIGAIVGLAISIWWGIGAILYPPASQALDVSSDMCDATTGYSSLVNNAGIVAYVTENASVSDTIITESPQQNKSENGLVFAYFLNTFYNIAKPDG